jgi:hypothetical protein
MSKRVLIAALWFYAGWTFGGLLSFATGVPETLGPVLGGAAALAIVIDPLRRLRRSTRIPGSSLEALP